MIESEVIIVGGGPAGSTCAWKLKENGINSIILDKNDFPRTKLCAGWITPRVVRDLELNLNEYPGSIEIFNRFKFSFYGIKFPARTNQYSIRRYELDNYLLQRANVPVYKHNVNKIKKDQSHYIIDYKYRCKYLIGAGGTFCPVYNTFFKEINQRSKEFLIATLEQEFEYQYKDNNCYLWFFDKGLPGYSWYVPKGKGYLNIGIGGKFPSLKSGKYNIREHWNFLIEKLNKLNLVKNTKLDPRGYNYYLRSNVDNVHLDNAFIIGDSVGLATKDMGEGIGPAIESGILAADAIITGSGYSIKSITKFSFPNLLAGIFKKSPKPIK